MTTGQLPFWRRPVYATRLSAHAAFAVIVWPVLTLMGTIVTLMDMPYYSVDHILATKASLVGLFLSLPDMVLAGVMFFGISGFIFSRLGPDARARAFGFGRLGVEPLLAFTAVVAGISVSYPAVLAGPLFRPLSAVPAAGVVVLLMFPVTVGALLAARPGKRIRLAVTLLALGALSPVPLKLRSALERFTGHPSDVVVLGLDSVSHHDDIRRLKTWVDDRRGTWYEYPVAPGLLTNPVWSSILTMTPVNTHHVFHTFERLEAASALLTAARAKGYHTVAIFPDQLTCAVGSQAGFDEDRSGPVGWRQVLLPAFSNNSFLLPIVKPLLPRVRPMASAPNQAGTFTYDVRREVRGILRAGLPGRRALVAAHLTYTHLPAYPSSFDLSWTELLGVARAPAGAISDRSFDWQDVDHPTDPLQLQRWKLDYLQQVIQTEVDSARYLENGRELVIFSDHGHRRGLSEHNFNDERYHRVLLATFGRPARCPHQPISLIDIGSLLGLSDRRAEPIVEFTIAPLEIWPLLMKTARLQWSGDVELDAGLLAQVFAGLQRHRPWPDVRNGSCDMSVASR
jgi:hypothetical protein